VNGSGAEQGARESGGEADCVFAFTRQSVFERRIISYRSTSTEIFNLFQDSTRKDNKKEANNVS